MNAGGTGTDPTDELVTGVNITPIVDVMLVLLIVFLSFRGISVFFTDYLWFQSVDLANVWSGLLGAKLALGTVFTPGWLLFGHIGDTRIYRLAKGETELKQLTADDTQVRIVGRRAWSRPEAWVTRHRESDGRPFELVLAHDHAIEVGRIAAELRDGILRVSLPKTEAVKPRRIAVA